MTRPAGRLAIGFASLYAWRPHVEHLHYLATLARQDGHDCHFLVCDADLPHCYTRELRDVRPDWQECLACRLGGLRSYEGSQVESIGALQEPEGSVPADSAEWALSSASTLGRFESPDDFASPAFHEIAGRLAPSTAIAYRAARNWIARHRLDAVCVFNGRMDATRAIFEAARDAGIRVVSVERTWFGNGLQLLPDEHCLGLRSVWRLVSEWKDRPLDEARARRAAALAARRFLRDNTTEWRAYNLNAVDTPWPVAGAARKVLFLPSSTNEIWGHPDWRSGWASPTEAVEAVMARLGLAPRDVVMRCHPNWSERIGKQDGRLPERYYSEWARSLGIHVIPSQDTASTMDLIEQCDLLVLQVGSAALEAGVLGKRIVSTAPSTYHLGGFTDNVHGPGDLASLEPLAPPGTEDPSQARERARLALRFAYTMAYRVAQYAGHVRAESSSRYRYAAGADPARLTRLLATGELEPDDAGFATTGAGEDAVLDAIGRRDWAGIASAAEPRAAQPVQRVRRRWLFRPIDTVRSWMPVGDR